VGEAASRGVGEGLLGDLVEMAVRGLGDGGGHAVVPSHRSVSTRIASWLAGSSPRLPSGRVAGIDRWRRGPTANPRSGCTYASRGPVGHANGLLLLTLAGSRISAMTRFDNSVLPRFSLPRTLPD
jgi:hypothetical protein